MFKVVVKNLSDEITHRGEFKTLQEAEAWSGEIESKSKPWGYFKPRTKFKEDCTPYDLTLVINEYEYEFMPAYTRPVYQTDENGDFVMTDQGAVDFEGNPILSHVVIGEETVPAIFKTMVDLKQNYSVEILDLNQDPEWVLNNEIEENIKLGKLAKQICDDCLHVVRGHNKNANLSKQDIKAMKTTFADILDDLNDGMPVDAKVGIAAVNDPSFDALKVKLIKVFERYGM